MRHRLTVGRRNCLHDAAHFGTVFSLAFRKAAHRLDQVIVLLAREPWRRYATDQFLLMTSLAYRHCGRRRGGGGVHGSRPLLCREVSRRGPHLFLGEVYRDLLHGVAGAISALEFMQLLQDIIFLQTPDDRNTLQFWRAVHTVAYPTNHQLAAEDSLGISRSDRKGQRGENAEQAENRRNALVRHDTVP